MNKPVNQETDLWIDIEDFIIDRATRKGEVTARMSRPNFRGKLQDARTMFCFRGEAMQAIIDLGMRFNVQINSQGAFALRFVRDSQGAIKATKGKAHVRLFLPTLKCWPNEDRPAEKVEWDLARDRMNITLRHDWAQPTVEA